MNVRPAGWLAGYLAWQKRLRWTLHFSPNFFIPAMLIRTIDFCHFILPSLTFTLPGGHKVSTKQNPFTSFSCTLLTWSDWKLMWWWSNSNWTSRDCFWVRFIETIEIKCFTDCVKKTATFANIRMYMNGFDSNFVWQIPIVLYILILI